MKTKGHAIKARRFDLSNVVPCFRFQRPVAETRWLGAALARFSIGTASILFGRFLLTLAAMNSVDAILAVDLEPQSRAVGDWPQWRGLNRDGVVVG